MLRKNFNSDPLVTPLIQDLTMLKEAEEKNHEENQDFLYFLKQRNDISIDPVVHTLNDTISRAIDCTSCGNCCRSLMINVEPGEPEELAEFLEMPLPVLKEKYIEQSLQGRMIVNTIPCHFLEDKKCTIYEHRFTECREFPHLHKPGFIQRLPGTLMHYGRCPIIFNVVESLKRTLDYK